MRVMKHLPHDPVFVFDVSGKSFGLYQQWLHFVLIDLTCPSAGSCSISSTAPAIASSLVIGCAYSGWPSEVRQRPVANSNCQPCIVQVSIPFSICAKRVRSAF